MARCLKPRGSLIIVDFTQPEADGPDACTFHTLPSSHTATSTSSSSSAGSANSASSGTTSPYSAYMHTDLEYALIKAGLYVGEREVNWVSKVLKATKPGVSAQAAPRRAGASASSGSSAGRVSTSNSSIGSSSSSNAAAVGIKRGGSDGGRSRVVTRPGGSPRGEGELHGVGH